jgi:O-antigen/teichoic acid export membrane protein
MIRVIEQKISSYLLGKDARTSSILKNVILSSCVRGGNILVSLILVPLTINYINPVQYGIWLTISSLVTWMSFFDIGMGHGLRNKVTTALSIGDIPLAKKYVSTTYASIAIIATFLFIGLCFVIPSVDWRTLLNIPNTLTENVNIILIIVFGTFSFQFIVQLINTVLAAIHKPALAGLISFIGQAALLCCVLFLTKYVSASLTILIAVITVVPLIVMLLGTILLYTKSLKYIAPELSLVDFSMTKKILNTGGAFFLIQLGAIVLFQTDNIIITKVLGPGSVTNFNVAYKLFSIVLLIFTIVITPYWSAVSDAYVKSDFLWMKRSLVSVRKIWFALSILSIALLAGSDWIFHAWLGKTIVVSAQLSIAMTFYVIIYMWQTLHVYFLNGIGKIKLQLILVLTSAVLNLPVAIYLGRHWGLPGIITANTIFFLLMGTIFYYQVQKILNQTARGIWGK